MRTFGRILLILTVAMLASAVAVYLYFTANWKRWLQEAMKENLRAQVEVEHINIDSWYPILNISLNKIHIIGSEPPFVNDTLLQTPRLTLGFDLYGALFQRRFALQSFQMEGGSIYLHAIDSLTNWDIIKTDPSQADTKASSEPSKFSLHVHQVTLKDIQLQYVDEAADMQVRAAPVTINGQGDYRGDSLVMDLQGTIGALTYRLENIPYLSNAHITYSGEISYHLPSSTFRFPRQHITINALALQADGFITLAEDTMPMYIALRSDGADLKSMLSLIPTIYQNNYQGLKARGTATFYLVMEGIYADNHFPNIQLATQIRQGWVTYPDLPHPVEDLQLNIAIQNEGHTTEQWAINMPQLTFQMQGDPFAATFLMNREHFQFSTKGTLHLEGWKDILQLDSIFPILEGTITSQLEGNATIQAIQNEQWEQIHWKGSLKGQNITWRQANYDIRWEIPHLSLKAAPQYFQISNAKIKWGTSDLLINGLIKNPMAYVLDKAPLQGTFSAQSTHLDLNPLITDGPETSAPAASNESAAISAPRLPDNLDLVFQMNAEQIRYEDWNIENFNGTMIVRNGRLRLDGIQAQWLGGQMDLNGQYQYGPNDPRPHIQWQLSGRKFAISQLGNALAVTQRFAPILQYMHGTLQLDASIESDLDPSLSTQLPTLQSQGRLMIPDATLEGFPLWQKVARILQRPDLEKARLQQVHLAYTIQDGIAEVKPIRFKINRYPAMFYGTYRLDDQMDFTLEMQVPASEAKALIRKFISGVDPDILGNQSLTIVARIRGTSQQPTITPSIKETRDLKQRLIRSGKEFIRRQKQQAQQRLESEKQKAKEALRQKKEKAKQKAQEELKRRQRQAEEKARQEVEQRKKELEQKAKQEAEKAKQKAKDALKKLLKKP